MHQQRRSITLPMRSHRSRNHPPTNGPLQAEILGRMVLGLSILLVLKSKRKAGSRSPGLEMLQLQTPEARGLLGVGRQKLRHRNPSLLLKLSPSKQHATSSGGFRRDDKSRGRAMRPRHSMINHLNGCQRHQRPTEALSLRLKAHATAEKPLMLLRLTRTLLLGLKALLNCQLQRKWFQKSKIRREASVRVPSPMRLRSPSVPAVDRHLLARWPKREIKIGQRPPLSPRALQANLLRRVLVGVAKRRQRLG